MERDNSKQWKVLQEWRRKGGSVQNDSELYGLGKRFLSIWHDTSIMTDEEMRSFGKYLYEKAKPEVQEKWGKVIDNYSTHWGANDKLTKLTVKQGKKVRDYEKMEDDKISRMIVCWEMAFQWLGPLADYRSLIKLWLAFGEEMVNNRLAKNTKRDWIKEMLELWPHFCWNLREQIHKQKFMALSVKPGFLTVLRMHRVKVLYASGRARYYNLHPWVAEDYTQTFGAALDTLLAETSLGEEDEQQDRVDFAVLMVMSLCGAEGEKLLLEGGAFEKFDVHPLDVKNCTKETFVLMAPSLAKHSIKILSLISTGFANDSLFPGGIERIMLILLSMLGGCGLKALSSIGRITDYLTEQCSKNNNWLIKLVCDHLHADVLRKRFVADDTKEGLNSIAGRLLKIMLMTMKADDAKVFVELMLSGSDSHLAALEEVTSILEDSCARPSSKSSKLKTGEKEFTIVTAWVGGAEKFKERLTAGGDVSSERNSCDLRILKNFLCLPFRVKKMDQIETGAFKADFTKLLPAMSRAWKELYLAVRSGAALVRGFNSDDFNVEIGTVIGEEGVKNYQLATPLSFILSMLAASESKKIFDNESGDGGSEFTKFSQLVINILDEATGRPLENFSCRGTVSALKIMQKLIDNHGEKAVMVLGNIITEFAKVALANKKSLMWTNATDCIMDVLESISTANRTPAKTFPGLEPLFSLLLSKKCWQASFLEDHNQLDMSENFWQLIKIHYKTGDWDPPSKFQLKLATTSATVNQSASVAAAVGESEKGPSTPVRGAQARKVGTPQRKNGTPQRRNGTPQRNGGTPQRYNRQLAALQGATQSSPKRHQIAAVAQLELCLRPFATTVPPPISPLLILRSVSIRKI
ncbi:Oidioi.mRNA.OKI2018_I69.XSR.g13504.t1.cds [Oikopleura dioica]|uniref:Oidioi.mRNA.OKI2018_I69.XSR.g13504.t1.cds n=1 Tax=Oikopleura dioica TaxID=34765 RepID=A0ABN7SAX7_OIKDI|nr:Oidioi.mRNA.OKI2018_I69.XSR.g13504.t1.cds [Oikopleura dioica]